MSPAIEIRRYGGGVEHHRHGFAQIVLPRRGYMEIEVDGCSGRVTEGRGVFIPAGAAHAYRASENDAFVVIDLHGIGDPRVSQPFFEVTAPIEALLDYLSLTGSGSDQSRYAWTRLLLDGMAHAGPRRVDDEAVIGRALSFMCRNLGEPIAVAEIAAVAGISTPRLHELFRIRTGQSPYATLVRMRVERARDLLCGTTLPIADIALMTGHADQSALNRRFKGLGCPSPAVVRRQGGPT